MPISWLADPMYSKPKGITEATNNAKCNSRVSSLTIAGRNLALSEYFKAISTKIVPSTRPMFAMFEPRTFPMDMSTFSGSNIANVATNSSGNDVEKATRTKPTVAFPKPEAPAIFRVLNR